jgi:hypothetical protein
MATKSKPNRIFKQFQQILTTVKQKNKIKKIQIKLYSYDIYIDFVLLIFFY